MPCSICLAFFKLQDAVPTRDKIAIAIDSNGQIHFGRSQRWRAQKFLNIGNPHDYQALVKSKSKQALARVASDIYAGFEQVRP